MDQETRWLTRYNEVKEFIEREHRNPSKYRLEEHDMLNWLKANRKKVNAGDRNAILVLLDDVRKLSRSVADIQMKNKLSV